jgi:hypothetical protein
MRITSRWHHINSVRVPADSDLITGDTVRGSPGLKVHRCYRSDRVRVPLNSDLITGDTVRGSPGSKVYKDVSSNMPKVRNGQTFRVPTRVKSQIISKATLKAGNGQPFRVPTRVKSQSTPEVKLAAVSTVREPLFTRQRPRGVQEETRAFIVDPIKGDKVYKKSASRGSKGMMKKYIDVRLSSPSK